METHQLPVLSLASVFIGLKADVFYITGHGAKCNVLVIWAAFLPGNKGELAVWSIYGICGYVLLILFFVLSYQNSLIAQVLY